MSILVSDTERNTMKAKMAILDLKPAEILYAIERLTFDQKYLLATAMVDWTASIDTRNALSQAVYENQAPSRHNMMMTLNNAQTEINRVAKQLETMRLMP